MDDNSDSRGLFYKSIQQWLSDIKTGLDVLSFDGSSIQRPEMTGRTPIPQKTVLRCLQRRRLKF